jgi:hypothetical protein
LTRAALDPRVLRAAGWALLAVRSTRRQLAAGSFRDVRVPEPPALPPSAGRGVHAVLRRLEPSCLERSLVLQRWLAAHGEPRTVVVGVSAPQDFSAHAWLEGEALPAGGPAYNEIARLAP